MTKRARICVVLCISAVFAVTIWTGVIRPSIAEYWFKAHRQTVNKAKYLKDKDALKKNKDIAEAYILKAIRYDPANTLFCLHAAEFFLMTRNGFLAEEFVNKTIYRFNGDVVLWAPYYYLAFLKFQAGSITSARRAAVTALLYNPDYRPVKKLLSRIEAIYAKTDTIKIKIR